MLKKARAQAQADQDAKPDAPGKERGRDLGDTVLQSSRQIWLAGLGAFARAQAEGGKVFESLVQQGRALEARTKQAAGDTAAAARGAAEAKAKEMQAKAGSTWDKLEQVFEDRVARALSRLGVYTHDDVERLAQRVDALSEAVNDLIRATGGTPRARKATPLKRAAKGAVPSTPKTARRTARRAAKAPTPR
jgi:poly(hydroxyalkanoate) granule-associated protein